MLRKMYQSWSKEELLQKVLVLEEQLAKRTASPPSQQVKKSKKNARPFDFEKYSKRFIALQVAYVGLKYNGFADQIASDANTQTVEGKIMEALLQCKLIKSRDPKECFFTRCGRTDTGVSGFGQIISLQVRSNLSASSLESNLNALCDETGKQELPYPLILNGSLPVDIRILAWAPVAASFNARFDCLYRKYKYFFHSHSLDIEAMKEASSFLIGTHDFRNFCKKDKSKPNQTFTREIMAASIQPSMSCGQWGLWEFEVKGSAFLYHQVRCMMGVLFLIGKGEKSVSFVKDLLDIERMKEKPSYAMASEIPLILHECAFEGLNLIPIEEHKKARIIEQFSEMWHENVLLASVSRHFCHELEK